ncbi:acylphosphatase [Microbacterium radiodurans]|uniref:acylphosphatase n=1 Tax=Microbacterium radiodurans TaxID=661398 RepID=A0A5J5IXK8_9MICO|nr:acylphosphatase [Microbacterium radiodurans]KAA9089881.1 acylphosphatase [Microbacterium radiodurans]
MRSVHVIVEGDVQGVGYRYTLRLEADRAGVAGWVRNRLDGSVEAVVEGADDRVDDVLAWMAEGPPGARVDRARVTDADPAQLSGFEVRDTA